MGNADTAAVGIFLPVQVSVERGERKQCGQIGGATDIQYTKGKLGDSVQPAGYGVGCTIGRGKCSVRRIVRPFLDDVSSCLCASPGGKARFNKASKNPRFRQVPPGSPPSREAGAGPVEPRQCFGGFFRADVQRRQQAD